MPLNPGTRLGPYEILDPVGAGGMGEVYRANDTRLGRSVAVKILPSHLSTDPDYRRRFDREARVISSLSHPHICAVYDVGHESGSDFLVMEYLEGRTLADRLLAGPLPLEDVLRIGREIAGALAAAHRSGVVHRDLKPGNVMLTPSGAKLLDFGLARMGVAGDAPAVSTTIKGDSGRSGSSLTSEGTILGTFQYMAPEQLEGAKVDARTDIFALGAVLYEMLTGRRAFEGKSQASLIASIMSGSPAPISQAAPLIPPALDRVVQVCLEKNPERRWQTAHDVALQLEWIAEGGSAAGISKPVAQRRRTRERAGVLYLKRPPVPVPYTVRFQIPPTKGLVSAGMPKISPDGRTIAFDGTDSTGVTRIWIQPLDALTAHPLSGTEGTTRPAWSPDSRSLVFFAGNQLKRVDAGGGAVRVLLDRVQGSDCTWSPEGVILFDGASGDSIRSVPAAGGVASPATRIDRARGQTEHAWPHFLPDGKHFLFQAKYLRGVGDSLMLGELGSFETRTLGPAGSLMDYSEPGYILWVQDGALRARRFDDGSMTFRGEPLPVATEISASFVGLAEFSVSRNGVLACRPGGSGLQQPTWVDRSGKPLSTLGSPGRYYDPGLDPTGHRVVVSLRDPAGLEQDLWILDDRGGAPSRLTSDPSSDFGGLWSPDGDRIAFTSTRSGAQDIYVKDFRGVGDAAPIWQDGAYKVVTDWSGDGRTLIVQRLSHETSWDLWAFPLGGHADPFPIVADEFTEVQGRLSPDGHWIAYSSDESGKSQIYVQPFPGRGAKQRVSSVAGTEPFWRGDGKELYYLTLDGDLMMLTIDTSSGFHSGTPQPLFHARVSANYQTRNRFCPSADGQRFLLLATGTPRLAPTTVVLNWTAELNER
jgi:serine/threonine protein kinase